MLNPGIPMFLPENRFVDYDDALGIDMDQGAADMCAWLVPFLCEVVMVGAVVTEVCAGSSSTPVFDFDKRPTAGSDASRGAADIGHLVLGTTAAGKVMFDEAAKGTILYPGDEIVGQLATAAVGTPTGHIRPFVLVKYLPEVTANLTDMVETA